MKILKILFYKMKQMNKFMMTFLLVIGVSTMMGAQENHRERIKAFKTAHITQQLDLSVKEAEKFWPVYNAYDKEMFSLKVLKVREEKNRIKEKGGMDALSDKEAHDLLAEMIQNEKETIKLKEKLYKDLSKILAPKKLLKLHKAEMDFNKKLLSEYRRKGPERQKP